MKSALITLLAFCLCLPLVGDDVAKKKFEQTKALAEKGDADAQNQLGSLYYLGEGVLENYVTSYAWYNITAANGDEIPKKNKGIIAKKMPPEQIAKAQELSREMVKKNPKLINE